MTDVSKSFAANKIRLRLPTLNGAIRRILGITCQLEYCKSVYSSSVFLTVFAISCLDSF